MPVTGSRCTSTAFAGVRSIARFSIHILNAVGQEGWTQSRAAPSVLAAALLVFLAATARTRIIPTGFWAPHHRLESSITGGCRQLDRGVDLRHRGRSGILRMKCRPPFHFADRIGNQIMPLPTAAIETRNRPPGVIVSSASPEPQGWPTLHGDDHGDKVPHHQRPAPGHRQMA